MRFGWLKILTQTYAAGRTIGSRASSHRTGADDRSAARRVHRAPDRLPWRGISFALFFGQRDQHSASTGPRPVFPHGDGFVWFCCFNSFRPKLEKLIPETRRGDHSGRKGGPHQRCVCALASQIGDRQTTVVVVVVYAAGLFSGSLLLFFPPPLPCTSSSFSSSLTHKTSEGIVL